MNKLIIIKKINCLVLFLFLLGIHAKAASYYVMPAGAGTKDGSSWANAFDVSVLNTANDVLLNTTMAAGDTLYIGSGTYSCSFTITSSGTTGSPKHILGVDTGGGKPVIDSNHWSRVTPGSNSWTQYIVWFADAAPSSYWDIENLTMRNAKKMIYATNLQGNHEGLIFRDLDISLCEYGYYMQLCNNMLLERCTVKNYTKHGYRLDHGCNYVTFNSCTADVTNGDTSWWLYTEAYPFGFTVYDGGSANTNVSFNDCVARNNRMNDTGYVSGTLTSGKQDPTYFNGDGFSVEGNSSVISFAGCISTNNEDGGFDIKPAASFVDCVAVDNHRGFRCWDTAKTLSNCTASYPFTRSIANPDGVPGGSGFWIQNGTAAVDLFSFYGDAGTGIQEDGNGQATLTNSIVAFSGTGGVYTSGSVNLSGTSSVTFRPGSGTDPLFVNPSISWDGYGNAMNSRTYGQTKGFSSIQDITAEADTYVYNADPNNNYGTSTDLIVKDAPNGDLQDRISYIRFPLSGMTNAASVATLKIMATAVWAGTGARTVQIRQVTDDSWSETGTTYNNRPSEAGTLIATIDASTVGEYDIDVTAFVNQEFSGDKKVSFCLVQPGSLKNGVVFCSRENTGHVPVLEIQ